MGRVKVIAYPIVGSRAAADLKADARHIAEPAQSRAKVDSGCDAVVLPSGVGDAAKRVIANEGHQAPLGTVVANGAPLAEAIAWTGSARRQPLVGRLLLPSRRLDRWRASQRAQRMRAVNVSVIRWEQVWSGGTCRTAIVGQILTQRDGGQANAGDGGEPGQSC